MFELSPIGVDIQKDYTSIPPPGLQLPVKGRSLPLTLLPYPFIWPFKAYQFFYEPPNSTFYPHSAFQCFVGTSERRKVTALYIKGKGHLRTDHEGPEGGVGV